MKSLISNLRSKLSSDKILQGFLKKISFILLFLGVIILSYTLFDIFLTALLKSLYFSGYPSNGAFQLFNPLRRLAAGQIPGHDFQFFHGLGVLYLHYPSFALFGKNLFAAELSREIISPLLFIAVSIFFTYSISKKLSVALVVGSALVLLVYPLDIISLYFSGNSLRGARCTVPLVVISTLILTKEFWMKKLSVPLNWKKIPIAEILLGLALALSIFFGTEHGFALFLAFIFTYLFFSPHYKNIKDHISRFFFILFFFILSLFSIFFITSGKYFIEPLKYAFIEVPSDQFWYFGVPPNAYLASISQIITAYPKIWIALVVALCLALLVLYIHLKKRNYETFFLLILAVYGIVSSFTILGVLNIRYLDQLFRVELFIVIWLLISILPKIIAKYIKKRRNLFTTEHLTYLISLLLVICIIAINPFSTFTSIQKLEDYLMTPKPNTTKYSGVYLDDHWAKSISTVSEAIGANINFATDPLTDKNWKNGIHINGKRILIKSSHHLNDKLIVGEELSFPASGSRTIIKVIPHNNYTIIDLSGDSLNAELDHEPIYIGSFNKNISLWSHYAGLIEVVNDIFHPSTDYIIHALGQERRVNYYQDFRSTQPQYVTTINPHVMLYEQWLRYSHWNFYSDLLQNYSAKAYTKYYIVWEKQQAFTDPNSQTWTEVPMEKHSANKIILPIEPSDELRLFEVEVNYEMNNPWYLLPYFGNMPRYLILPLDDNHDFYRQQPNPGRKPQVSLPPYENTWRFPVLLNAGNSNPVLELKAASIMPRVNFSINKLKLHELDITEKNLRYYLGLFDDVEQK